jgi:hypothetical protein
VAVVGGGGENPKQLSSFFADSRPIFFNSGRHFTARTGNGVKDGKGFSPVLATTPLYP